MQLLSSHHSLHCHHSFCVCFLASASETSWFWTLVWPFSSPGYMTYSGICLTWARFSSIYVPPRSSSLINIYNRFIYPLTTFYIYFYDFISHRSFFAYLLCVGAFFPPFFCHSISYTFIMSHSLLSPFHDLEESHLH